MRTPIGCSPTPEDIDRLNAKISRLQRKFDARIAESKRRENAYPKLVEALKRHVRLIPERATNELLKELGELE